MGESVEIIVHVPRVHIDPWRVVEPPPASFLDMPMPMPIGIRVPTPTALVELKRSRDQLSVLGSAMLETLEAAKPRFHRARLSATQLFESTGTTIMVTGYDRLGAQVLFATWDYGEPVDAPLQRLAEARRIVRLLPPMTARAMLSRVRIAELPPPQIILSNVISLIDDPITTLGGYDRGGADTPVTLAVGRQYMHLVVDHRIYNPPDEQALVKPFLERVTVKLRAAAIANGEPCEPKGSTSEPGAEQVNDRAELGARTNQRCRWAGCDCQVNDRVELGARTNGRLAMGLK